MTRMVAALDIETKWNKTERARGEHMVKTDKYRGVMFVEATSHGQVTVDIERR